MDVVLFFILFFIAFLLGVAAGVEWLREAQARRLDEPYREATDRWLAEENEK